MQAASDEYNLPFIRARHRALGIWDASSDSLHGFSEGALETTYLPHTDDLELKTVHTHSRKLSQDEDGSAGTDETSPCLSVPL